MKYITILAIGALTALAILLPEPGQPELADTPSIHGTTLAICPIEEGGGRTTQLTALSTGEGPLQLTLFAGGRDAGSIGVSIGETGSNVIPIVDVAAVGRVGGLAELPTPASAMGAVVRGAASLSAESCPSTGASSVYLTGGRTSDELSFEIQLMNPYAGEAVVDVTVSSEVGIESSDRFNSLIVPAKSSVILDMFALVPGRTRLSARVDATAGQVIVVGRQTSASDSAIWSASPGATDWLLPVPSGTAAPRLLIGNPSGQEVEFQVDVYGSMGLEEAVVSDTVGADGEVSIDLAGLIEGALVQGVRVISTSHVVANLWVEDATSMAVTIGATETAATWLLPGAATADGESQRVVILNPGLEDADVAIRSLRATGSGRSMIVPAQTVVELVLERADGFIVESTIPVVAEMYLTSQGPSSLSLGVPVSDG